MAGAGGAGDAATDSTWVDGSGNWNDPAHWTAGIPDGVDAVARFTVAPSSVYVNGPSTGGATVGTMILAGGTPGGSYTFGTIPGYSLTFDVSSGSAALQVSGSGASYSFASNLPVVLKDPLAVTVGDGAYMYVGTLTGTAGGAGITKAGNGLLALDTGVSFNGPVTVQAGTLSVSSTGALGSTSSVVTVAAGATLSVAADFYGATNTYAQSLVLSGTGTGGQGVLVGVSQQYNGNIANWTGPVTLAGDSSIGVYGNATYVRLMGNIGDGGAGCGLTKVGDGSLTLSGTNSYTGPTVFAGGFLTLASNSALARGTTLTVTSGEVEMAGYHITVGQVTVNGGDIYGGTLSTTAPNFDLRCGTLSAVLDGTAGVVKTTTAGAALGAANTFSGPTVVAAGQLWASEGSGLSPNSNLVIGGGMLVVYGNINRALGTAGGQIQWTGTGGFSTFQGCTVNFGGSGGTVIWGSPYFLPAGQTMALGADNLAGELELKNAVDLGGQTRTVWVAASYTPWYTTTGGYALLSGAISNGGLTKVGPGILALSAANSYAGLTSVNEGALDIRNNTALGSTAAGTVVAAGGELQMENNLSVAEPLTLNGSGNGGLGALRNMAGTSTWSGSITLATDAAIGGQSGTVLTISGVIGDSGAGRSLTKADAGTTVLTGTNTYSGPTVVAQGGLRAADGIGLPTASNLVFSGGVFEGRNTASFNRALGTGAGQVRWTDGGGFAANGGKLTVNIGGHATPDTLIWGTTPYFVSATSALQFGSNTSNAETELKNPIDLGGGQRTISLQGGGYATLSGGLSNGNINLTGYGQLVLKGTSSLTGTANVQGGTLSLGAANVIPNANVNITDGYFDTGAYNNSVNQVTLNGGGGINGTTGTLTANSFNLVNGQVMARLACNTGLTVDNTGYYSNSPWGIFLYTPLSFAGPTWIKHGTVTLEADNVLPTTQDLIVDDGLDMYGHQQTVRTAYVDNGIGSSSGTGVLTANSFELRGGMIIPCLSGSGGVNKTTAAEVYLTTDNTYTGPTTIMAGSIRIATPGGLGAASAGTTINSGGSLNIDFGGTVAEPITLNGGTVGSGYSSTLSGAVTLTGSAGNTIMPGLTLTGGVSGTNTPLNICGSSPWYPVILASPDTHSGGTTIQSATLRLNAGSLMKTSGSVTITGAGALDLQSYSQTLAQVTVSGGSILGTGTLTVTAADYDLTDAAVAAKLAGNVNLVSRGQSTLSNANSYTGTTTVSSGSLTLMHSGAVGTSGAGTTVCQGASLNLQGGVKVNQPLTLAGGRLYCPADNNTWSGAIALTGTGGDFAADYGYILTVSGTVTGTGNMRVNGNWGTVLLTGTATHTGGTDIPYGVLQLGGNERLPHTGPLVIEQGYLDLQSYSQTVDTVSLTQGGWIQGTGTLTATGGDFQMYAGQVYANLSGNVGMTVHNWDSYPVILNGACTYTGPTTVQDSGGIQLGGNNRLPTTGALTLNNGALDLQSYSQTLGPVSVIYGNITGSGTLTSTGTAYDVRRRPDQRQPCRHRRPRQDHHRLGHPRRHQHLFGTHHSDRRSTRTDQHRRPRLQDRRNDGVGRWQRVGVVRQLRR